MYDKYFDLLKEMIIEEVGTDAELIKPEASLVNDLGINSLEFMSIIMAVEEKLEITLDEDRLGEIKTVDDVVKYITELKG